MPKTAVREEHFTYRNWDRNAKQIAIQDVDQPGCYVDSRHGYLCRVTPEMLDIGGTPFMGFTSNDPWHVTKISDDPNMPLDECRIVAANYSLRVNF